MIASVLNILLNFALHVMSESRNRLIKLVVCYLFIHLFIAEITLKLYWTNIYKSAIHSRRL